MSAQSEVSWYETEIRNNERDLEEAKRKVQDLENTKREVSGLESKIRENKSKLEGFKRDLEREKEAEKNKK